MVIVGVLLRHIDVFVLQMDDTWMNILPCKVLSLVILLGIFWYYRRDQIGPVLGLSRSNLRTHIILGVALGITIILMSNIVSVFVYQFFFDPSLSVVLEILLGPELLVYTFIFFAINAVYEETLFRGLLQNAFRERHGPVAGILLSATVFGFWHLIWPLQTFLVEGVFPLRTAVVMVIFSGLLGVVFGVYYEKFSGRAALVGTIVAHTLINYINEGFKVAFDTVTQGPDLSFINPVHMAIGLTLALGTFSLLIVFFWKFRIEEVRDAVKKAYRKRVSRLKPTQFRRNMPK